MTQGPSNPNTFHCGSDRLYCSSDKGQTVVPASQISGTDTPALPPLPSVSASGISPQNDYVSSFGICSGHVFGTAVGAPLLTEVTSPVSTRRFIGRAVIEPKNATSAYFTLVVMASLMASTSGRGRTWTRVRRLHTITIKEFRHEAFDN
jgi:hypothetical protein